MDQNQNWDRQALEHLLLENLKESRKARRWKAILRLLTLVLLVGLIYQVFDLRIPGSGSVSGRHTALVSIEGEIAANSVANASDLNAALDAAFENKDAVGIILRINSPGGSPVQAGMINDEIRRLRTLYPDKPLNVVVEDVCASGGYYIAVAGDKILVDKASLVGSIGVIMGGFGFTGLMDKLGISRRLLTAGSNKGMLDPFSKENPQQMKMVQEMLDEIHQQFIAIVKQGRGNRLKDNPEIFSGRVWNGQQAVDLGLADGFGTVENVARDVYKAPDIIDYTLKENFAERVAKRFGAEMGAAAGKAMMRSSEMR
ncbi:MAG: S49 family peptidase [Polynucleobacter sp.]|jgi:protease-4|nr:S49 family peptidase [Polynucleobacter sp.]